MEQLFSIRHDGQVAISRRFWVAFFAMLQKLGKEHIFIGYVRRYDDWSGWDDSRAREFLRERIGVEISLYSKQLTPSRPSDPAIVIDFVECFYAMASGPKQVAAREDNRTRYAREVNGMFRRFNMPYELVSGQVHRRGSEWLDVPVEKIRDLQISDKQLRSLLQAAATDFFNAREDRRLSGLRLIADAFERVKTLREGNKKASANRIVAELAGNERLHEPFDNLFQALTAISNKTNIRHSETDKVEIDGDSTLIEFLFYSLFALIRAVLERERAGS